VSCVKATVEWQSTVEGSEDDLNSVTLTPRGKLTASKPEELVVNGTFLTDTLGRESDSDGDGQPGGDYIATISGNRVTVGGVPLMRTQPQPATVPDAIDILLTGREPTAPARSPRVRSEARLAAKLLEIHLGGSSGRLSTAMVETATPFLVEWDHDQERVHEMNRDTTMGEGAEQWANSR
jgi:hypothetical protein